MGLIKFVVFEGRSFKRSSGRIRLNLEEDIKPRVAVDTGCRLGSSGSGQIPVVVYFESCNRTF